MLLREIEVFRAVVLAGSATKAARLLGVTQPAVSQALKRLEQHAGMPLFQRVRGSLQPTREAHALLNEVNRCFVGLDAIEHRIRSLRQFGLGRVRVACPPAYGGGFFARVLAHLRPSEQQLSVSLQVMSSMEARHRLLALEADVGLIAAEVPTGGLEHSPFSALEAVVALPQRHPLCTKKVITPAMLARYPLIVLNPEDAASVKLNNIFASHGVTPTAVVETPFTVSICELVSQGVGVGLVNSLTALDYADRRVELRPFSEKLDYVSYLAMPVGQPLTAQLQQLISVMRTRLSEDQAKLRALLEAS